MNKHNIWCPNVILLDPGSLDEYPSNQILDIKNSIPKDLTFLFVAIGTFHHNVVDAQIILKHPDYSIYKENIKDRKTLTSDLLEAGMQHVYYINAKPEFTKVAFIHFIDILGFDYPILCLASKLSSHLHPAAHVIPESTEFATITNEQNKLPYKYYTTSELTSMNISFIHNKIAFN